MMNKYKAIILDKDGVFVNFNKVWLRIIAYRAQLIAEISTGTWDRFDKVRTACIRAMGVDEDLESVDPYSPSVMPASDVKLALKVATYLTVYEWDAAFTFKQAHDIVETAFAETWEALNVLELSEPIEGSIEKIKEIADAGIKIGIFSSDTTEHINGTLDKFKIKSKVSAVQGDYLKSAELYKALCKKLSIDPEETVMVSDAPHDLIIAKEAGARTIGVLSGVVSKENMGSLKVVADEVLGSLADLNVSKLGGSTKTKKASR